MFNWESVKRLWRYQSKRLGSLLLSLQDPVLRQVMTKGYAVIENYWNAERCRLARNAIDDGLNAQTTKIWQDAVKADKRLMGANHLNEALDLVSDPRINSLIERLYNCQTLSKFTMAARLNAVAGNLGSGQGWHRDSTFVYQFKAILYLSDVEQQNGPFQYIPASGNALSMLLHEARWGFSVDKYRFSEEDIEGACLRKPTEFCAPQGTLLLVNTRGIHRGKPIEAGQRYALTNYYWPGDIPAHIAEYVN
jgi:hypothetical protein